MSYKDHLCNDCGKPRYSYISKGKKVEFSKCSKCKNKMAVNYHKKIKKTDPFNWKASILTGSANNNEGQRHSKEEIKKMMVEFDVCPYCLKKIDIKRLSLDHIKPLFRGGTNDSNNIHLVCMDCNSMKGILTNEEFKSLLQLTGIDTEFYKIMRSRLKAAGGFIHRR